MSASVRLSAESSHGQDSPEFFKSTQERGHFGVLSRHFTPKENYPMQKFLLIGFVGRDPEMKYTPGGTAITTFSVASTERWKNSGGELQEHTEWFNVKSFGRRAEVAAEFLKKGSRVFLEGRQRIESWDDKKSGEKKYMCFLYVDKIEFLGESNRNGHGNGNGQNGEVAKEQSHSQEDPAMVGDSDTPF
jgi:single-strand DNA-binding protein